MAGLQRELWRRLSPELILSLEDIRGLLGPALAGAVLTGVQSLRGGIANSNFKLCFASGPPMLLRIYQRGIAAAAKEVALLRRLCADVPVPTVYHFAASNELTGHPYALLQWIDGERLDQLAGHQSTLAGCGCALGKALARVHAIRFPHCGFLGPELQLTNQLGFSRDDLLAFLDAHDTAVAQLGSTVKSALQSFVASQGYCLADWSDPCLIHGDLNGSNLLFAGSRARVRLAAILDWEFAFSGSPAFDFAQLLRPPLGQHAELAQAAVATYRAAGGRIPRHWRQIARMIDLFAWIDMLSRPGPDPQLIEDARQSIQSTLRG